MAERIFLGVCVVINAAIGLACLWDPVSTLEPMGLAVIDNAGLVELRAMYGGLELGLAFFLAWCIRDESRLRTGVMAMTVMLVGLGVARLGAFYVFQPEGSLMPLLILIELGGAGVGSVLLWRTRAATPQQS